VLLTSCLRNYFHVHETTLPFVAMIIISSLTTLGMGIVLIFGKFGLPELGLEGAGIALFTSRAALLAMVLVYSVKKRPELFHRNKNYAHQIIKLGLPVALQLGLMMGIPFGLSIYTSYLGALEMAASRVLISHSALIFTIGLGMSEA